MVKQENDEKLPYKFFCNFQKEGNDDDSGEEKNKDKARQDNSLSVLTRKFINLIKNADNKTVDLNEAVTSLAVQKRRIYDITNVLQGVGYVQKTHKNTIKWLGDNI